MGVYEVPLVSTNLRPQEMILQMADTLDYLESVSNDIFSKVDARIQESRKRIQNINQRVDVAQSKIAMMTGSRKATRIFSSSRFPGALQSTAPKMFAQASVPAAAKSKPELDSTEVPLDNDLVFYPAHNYSAIGTDPSPLPPESVSELLVFNTEDLAFREKSVPDRGTKFALRRKHDSAETAAADGGLLGDAPWSISQRDQLERTNQISYSYTPGKEQSKRLKLISIIETVFDRIGPCSGVGSPACPPRPARHHRGRFGLQRGHWAGHCSFPHGSLAGPLDAHGKQRQTAHSGASSAATFCSHSGRSSSSLARPSGLRSASAATATSSTTEGEPSATPTATSSPFHVDSRASASRG